MMPYLFYDSMIEAEKLNFYPAVNSIFQITKKVFVLVGLTTLLFLLHHLSRSTDDITSGPDDSIGSSFFPSARADVPTTAEGSSCESSSCT